MGQAIKYMPGQRIQFKEEGETKTGLILHAREPLLRDSHSGCRYVVAWEEGEKFDQVMQSDMNSGTWSVLPGGPHPKLKEIQWAYARSLVDSRIKKINAEPELPKQVQQAAAVEVPAEEKAEGPIVAFYRPPAFSNPDRLRLPIKEFNAQEFKQSLVDFKKHLAVSYPGVEFHVRSKHDSLTVTWVDGPASIDEVSSVHVNSKKSPLNAIASITQKREFSDELILAAINFVQCACRINEDDPQHARLADPALYRTGVFRTVFLMVNRHEMSYHDLTRLALMRWDDCEQRFLDDYKNHTRYMILENKALFGGFDSVNDASSLMCDIRSHLTNSGDSEFFVFGGGANKSTEGIDFHAQRG